MANLPLNQILHGDCLELFKKIPNNSIDCIFADPPFNLKKKYNSHKDKLKCSEYLQWCQEWINECLRVLKNDGCLFFAQYSQMANFLRLFS